MKRLFLLVAVVVTTLAGAGTSLAAKPVRHTKPHVVKHRMARGAGQAKGLRTTHRQFKGRHGKHVRRLHSLVPGGGYGSDGCYPPLGTGDGCYPPDGSGDCRTPDWPDGCDDGCTSDGSDDGCWPTYPDDCCPPG